MKSIFLTALALFSPTCYAAAHQKRLSCGDYSGNYLDLLFHYIEKENLKKVKKVCREHSIFADQYHVSRQQTPLECAAQVGSKRIFVYLWRHRLNEVSTAALMQIAKEHKNKKIEQFLTKKK